MTQPTTPPLVDRAAITPSVDDVALLLRTRTVGFSPGSGLGSDTGPTDITTFSATTRPTDTEAEAMIQVALDETTGRLPERIDVRLYPAISRAIAQRAAQLIEVSFFKETTGDAAYQTTISALTEAAAAGSIAIASGVSDRELAIWAPWPVPAP